MFVVALTISDTRTTQWEDPRLSNPQIAGPVSALVINIVYFRTWFIHIFVVIR